MDKNVDYSSFSKFYYMITLLSLSFFIIVFLEQNLSIASSESESLLYEQFAHRLHADLSQSPLSEKQISEMLGEIARTQQSKNRLTYDQILEIIKKHQSEVEKQKTLCEENKAPQQFVNFWEQIRTRMIGKYDWEK
jgi:hypothetical protein